MDITRKSKKNWEKGKTTRLREIKNVEGESKKGGTVDNVRNQNPKQTDRSPRQRGPSLQGVQEMGKG